MSSVPPSARSGAVAGTLGAGLALLVLLAGQAVGGSSGFLEAIHNGVTRYVPLDVFDAAIGTFGPYAKGLLLVGVAIALVVAGALVGALLVRARLVGGPGPVRQVAVAAGVAWLAAELIVLPAFGAGLVGGDLPTDPAALHLPLALASIAYGVVLVGVVRAVETEPSSVAPPVVGPDGPVGAGGDELEPPGGPITDLSWVRRKIEVPVPEPGRVALLARATDERGNVQDATPRPPLPSGATGLHRVVVEAVG